MQISCSEVDMFFGATIVAQLHFNDVVPSPGPITEQVQEAVMLENARCHSTFLSKLYLIAEKFYFERSF